MARDRTDISDYLFNELNGEEREMYEKKIRNDTEAKKSFRNYSEIRDYLKERISFEEMTDDPQLEEARRIAGLYDNPGSVEPPAKNNQVRRLSGRKLRILIPIGIAASLILGFIILRSSPVSDNSGLYEKYYEPLNVVGKVYRGEESSHAQNELESGLMLYQGKDYTGAEEVFSKLAESSPMTPLLSLYLGLSNMAVSHFEEAITLFNNHLIVFDEYIPEVQWYLSLCYIKTGHPEKAVRDLKELSGSGGYFGKRADELLSRLH